MCQAHNGFMEKLWKEFVRQQDLRFSFVFSDICSCSQNIKGQITTLLRPLAESYLKVYERQKQCDKLKQHKKEEFFGLRDFYRYTS